MSMIGHKSRRLPAALRYVAGLAVAMGLSAASYAAPISLSASDFGQGNPQGTWATQPQNPNISLWLTKSVDTTPDGVFYSWASLGYLQFDTSAVTIPTGQAVSAASVTLHVKANSGASDQGYIDLMEIKSQAQPWHAADTNPATLTWAGVGQYYGDRVGTTPKLTFPKSGSDLEVVIPLDVPLVQGWVDGSVANRGLEIWFRPTINAGGLNLRGPDTPSVAPMLAIDFAPVPEPATGLMFLCGGWLLAGRRRWKKAAV